MWLLTAAVKQAIEHAEAAGFTPSAEQQADYMARFGFDTDEGGARLLTVAGDVAEIRVAGVITKAPSFMAMLFGGGNTTYSDINAALAAADADPTVARAEIRIDSPGGHFDGLFDTLAAIQSFSKPIAAVVHNQAASAAYAIASQTDRIVAANRAARVGSIGVAASFSIDDKVVDIASTAAPKKRPDVATAEGRAVVREELDAMHELFADAIATGRGVTVTQINADYGQGATLLADEALKRGMIDAIASTSNHTAANAGGINQEQATMDLKSLQAQHPDVYEAAVSEGVTQERDRVTSHLVAGQAAGMIDEAIAAVEAGTAMTSTMSTKYMMAAVNRGDQSNRQTDDEAAAAATIAAAADEDSASASDLVLAAVEQKLGITSQGV